MWKGALIEISARARSKAALNHTEKFQRRIIPDIKIQQAPANGAVFSPSADGLYDAGRDYHSQLRRSAFRTSLVSASPPLRFIDEEESLLRDAAALPFVYAHEAFCTLMKAGEVPNALQLMSFWIGKLPKQKLRLRRKVKRELLQTITELEKMKDGTTLKALVEMMAASVREQQFAQKKIVQSVYLMELRDHSSSLQYKLFAPLGITTASAILVRAVEALSRLGRDDGIAVMEKLVLLDKCTIASPVYAGAERLPYQLHCLFESWVSQGQIDMRIASQVCPNFTSKLVHPSHFSTLDIISLSLEEAKYIQRQWVSKMVLHRYASEEKQVSKWRMLVDRLLPHSETLKAVEAQSVLISFLAGCRTQETDADRCVHKIIRSNVVKLLQSPEVRVRRFVSAELLKRRRLLPLLRISSLAVASVFAQSFCSKGVINSSLCALCRSVLIHDCRRERYAAAARVAWNHLSVHCTENVSLFQSDIAVVNATVVSISRTMQEAARRGHGERWMGYRSLSILRVASTHPGQITVMHCVPVCAGAIACGVPFAAVAETLSVVFASDAGQKEWALNLIRLCAESETVPKKVLTYRHGVAVMITSRFSQLCGFCPRRCKEVVLQSPSRSKQIALWTSITESQPNPRLNALMMAVFLNQAIRQQILNCTHLVASTPKELFTSSNTSANETSITDQWSWEVAASLASNCTTEQSFRVFLECLKRRRPKHSHVISKQIDNVAAVLRSELDSCDTSSTGLTEPQDVICSRTSRAES